MARRAVTTDGVAPLRCALCVVVLGRRAVAAVTMVRGTAVCADHVSYVLDEVLIRQVRDDAAG